MCVAVVVVISLLSGAECSLMMRHNKFAGKKGAPALIIILVINDRSKNCTFGVVGKLVGHWTPERITRCIKQTNKNRINSEEVYFKE